MAESKETKEKAKVAEEKKETSVKAAEEKKEKAVKAKETKKISKSSKNIDDILGAIESMTVLELSELVKALEDKFEVSAQSMVAAAPAAGAAGAAGGAAPSEVKSEFDVEIKSPGQKKIEVIKAVRQITSLGLREAKDLVDKAPKVVKEKVPAKEAEKLKSSWKKLVLKWN